MLGAIIGDTVGSVYEFNPIKRKEFPIFNSRMRMTDDSYLTLAVARVLSRHFGMDYSQEELKQIQKELKDEFLMEVKTHPRAGWGGRFRHWATSANPEPYYSCGNGSAMRISSVAYFAKSEEQVKILAKTVSEITHNHPEGIKGAEAIATAIYLALHGASKEEIRSRMLEYYPHIANMDYLDLVKNYQFSEICQQSCPEAIYCFLISVSLEDAIRNCIGIGGDCDTTAAMAGAIAEAYYGNSAFEEEFKEKMLLPEVASFCEEFIQKAKQQ